MIFIVLRSLVDPIFIFWTLNFRSSVPGDKEILVLATAWKPGDLSGGEYYTVPDNHRLERMRRLFSDVSDFLYNMSYGALRIHVTMVNTVIPYRYTRSIFRLSIVDSLQKSL